VVCVALQTLHIVLDVHVDGDEIVGHTGDGATEPIPFSGWLGLIAALDGLLHGRPATGADGTARDAGSPGASVTDPGPPR
jgi:hypothetical protein